MFGVVGLLIGCWRRSEDMLTRIKAFLRQYWLLFALLLVVCCCGVGNVRWPTNKLAEITIVGEDGIERIISLHSNWYQGYVEVDGSWIQVYSGCNSMGSVFVSSDAKRVTVFRWRRGGPQGGARVEINLETGECRDGFGLSSDKTWERIVWNENPFQRETEQEKKTPKKVKVSVRKLYQPQ